MDASAFLIELEALTHAARQRRMVDLGRSSRESDDDMRLIEELARSEDAYARALVAASLHGSRDGVLALKLMGDPSRLVRRRAARAVPFVCDDAQATQAIAGADSSTSRTLLVKLLRGRRRLAPVDAFFEAAGADAAEDRALVDALPFASAAMIDKSFSLIETAGGPVAWARIAKVHPARFATYVSSVSMRDDPRLRYRITAVAAVFARMDPTAALGVLRTLLEADEEPGSPIVRAMLPSCMHRQPRETFDVLRARHERGAPVRPPGALGILRLDHVAHRLGGERLAYVVEHAWSALSDGQRARRWLLRLSPGDRNAVINAWLARGRGGWGGFLLRHIARGRNARRPTRVGRPKRRTAKAR